MDIQVCAEGMVGLGLGPMVEDCLALTLQELSDMDDQNPHPTIWHPSTLCLCHPVSILYHSYQTLVLVYFSTFQPLNLSSIILHWL